MNRSNYTEKMRVLIIGAGGTIGKKLTPRLRKNHDVITAGRSSGDVNVDISSQESIKRMFDKLPKVDACICIAASGPMDDFATITEDQLKTDMQAKLFGQINLVLIGQHYLNDNGCFTLTSGVFADVPYKGVTGGALTSGALHSFTLSASVQLPRNLRINVVSPGMAEDSAAAYAQNFPGLAVVPMESITDAYELTVEQEINGQILRIYQR